MTVQYTGNAMVKKKEKALERSFIAKSLLGIFNSCMVSFILFYYIAFNSRESLVNGKNRSKREIEIFRKVNFILYKIFFFL